MLGGRRPPPNVRFQSSCFALEGLDDQPDTSEKNRQPSKPASPFQHQGEPITAMTLAAKLAMRDISASSSISPRANSKYLVRGRPRDRSQHLRCDRRSRMRARSNHPAGRDASEPGHCPWGSRPQTRGEASGGARRVLPIEGADRLAGKVTTTLVVINYSPGRGLLTINVLVAARRVLLRRLKETDDLLETFLRSRQPSNSGLRIPGAWRPRFRA